MQGGVLGGHFDELERSTYADCLRELQKRWLNPQNSRGTHSDLSPRTRRHDARERAVERQSRLQR